MPVHSPLTAYIFHPNLTVFHLTRASMILPFLKFIKIAKNIEEQINNHFFHALPHPDNYRFLLLSSSL